MKVALSKEEENERGTNIGAKAPIIVVCVSPYMIQNTHVSVKKWYTT